MAKAHYVGVNGIARKVKQPYIGVGGVARKVKNGYVGVGGVARQYFQSGTPIGTLSVGTSVYMNVNGVRKEFIVINQGRPSTTYDTSCNGTWLLMKEIYTMQKWDSTNNDYANSDIHNYLNTTFFNLLDADISSQISQVKIPYTNGPGGTSKGSLATGSNGLSTHIFLLSLYETGLTYSGTTSQGPNMYNEGAKISYFNDNTKRIAYYQSTATVWATRSPYLYSTMSPWHVNTNGTGIASPLVSGETGVRPAFVVPSTTLVDSKFNVIA